MTATIIFSENVSSAPSAETSGDSLWLSLLDLTKATGWELKPEGVCRDEVCIPVPEERRGQLLRGEGGASRFNLTEFARLVEQPLARDEKYNAWYFGQPSWEWQSRLSDNMAPDFTLPDFEDNQHNLSDYRGKKVFLLCWASWCSCRFDLPYWNDLHKELRDKNFEVITVACESKGAAAALPFIEAAKPENLSLLDERHVVPELYNTRNVPAAFWIDENGKIARANDPIYAARRNRETSEEKVNHRYMDAVRDWVAMGPESEWVREAVDGSMGRQTWENQLALAHFRLGLYLHQRGHTEDAIAQFKKAHELEPGNWNYKRQTWNLGDISKDYGYENILSAIRGPGLPEFYRQVDIVNGPLH